MKRLVDSFLTADPSISDGHLLQIVLVGRPQLKDKLPQVLRLPEQLRLAVMCELIPLADYEVATYIQEGLHASSLPTELFDSRAIGQIARYSCGVPRVINAVCDRALQIFMGCSSGNITNEIIDVVAQDLQLRQANPGEPELDDKQPARERDADPVESFDLGQFQIGERDTTEIVGETFLQYNADYDRSAGFRSGRRETGLVVTLVILIFIVGAGVWLLNEATAIQLAVWRDKFLALVQAGQSNDAAIKTTALPQSTIIPAAPPAQTNPGLPFPPQDDQMSSAPSAAQSAETIVEAPHAAPGETFPVNKIAPPVQSPVKPTPSQRKEIQRVSPPHHEDLAAEVRQAIDDRAIMGVAVSVVQDTAILDGQVASERQRSTAERAAWSVSGIKHVRNRISVNYG